MPEVWDDMGGPSMPAPQEVGEEGGGGPSLPQPTSLLLMMNAASYGPPVYINLKLFLNISAPFSLATICVNRFILRQFCTVFSKDIEKNS